MSHIRVLSPVGVASSGAHALSTHPEELELPCLCRARCLCGDSRPRLSSGAKLRRVSQDSSAQRFHELRAIHFAGSLAG